MEDPSLRESALTFALHAPVTRAFMEADDFWNRMIRESEGNGDAKRMESVVRARLEAEGFLPKSAYDSP